jgi:hypothetical protein
MAKLLKRCTLSILGALLFLIILSFLFIGLVGLYALWVGGQLFIYYLLIYVLVKNAPKIKSESFRNISYGILVVLILAPIFWLITDFEHAMNFLIEGGRIPGMGL